MNVNYVNPFIKSTIETFGTMLGESLKPGKPTAKKSPFPTYDVSGIIGLSGNAQGAISISFPKAVALKIASKMLGSPVKVVGFEMADAIGELVNIIAGRAKKDLIGYELSISLPNVVMGTDHVLNSISNCPTIVVPFRLSLGDMTMEVSLTTKED
ncbi:MAG: chemotaxis protein CheX [Chitinivibrionales bacterium]|nr:chemotaxis protein CheX [Chitinivibrionales bacterium]MBD3359031.1 chemotaxis protein CheX [Chitinivibrionales bacterium]